ncbi:MAG: FAD-dependent oxidoreductase [Erysipelotrichaceae bacterium]|nr:FAD-dependent oxidoreductase [Erysipelotrichaceae bacterium]
MAEMSTVIKPKRMGEKNPNPKILALGKKITDVALHKLGKVTSDDPEYWGLADLVTDEMADIGLAMKMRHPYTFEEISKLVPQFDKEKLQKLLDEMSFIGLLEYDYGYHYDHNGRTAPQSERRYILPMFVPGSAELFNMHEDPETGENRRIEEHPEVAPFFERMTYIPLAGITQLVPPGGAGIGMHVIPVEKAILMENKKVDLEQLSYWLDKYEGHIGVGQCSCRTSRGKMEEGVADDNEAWCIGVGDFADYCRETHKGHDITKEEALAILKRGEELGYVHQITNIDGDNKIFGICNCNVNICNALRTSQLFNTPNMSASAYRAKVDREKCVACGKCVEVCPAGAARLGQKLCKKDGSLIKYPRIELPDATKWGKDKWDENYRDTRTVQCHDTGTAPCKSACPAHIAIQGYLKKAAQGDYLEALKLIKKDNPFPAVCGRICNKRCEEACTRGTIDRAVSIDAVKKFIAEQELKAENRYIPPVKIAASPGRTNKLERWPDKIAIIGAGPAGLTAAYYLGEMGYKVTVFEKNAEPGGMLRYGIPSYKLEKDVIDAEIEIIKELGADIRCNVEVGKDVTIAQLKEEGYAAFYIAIGCQGGRYPGVENDHAKGTAIAIDFLKEAYENNGQKIDGDVIVVGGGNVAIDCARTAHRFHANKVSMFALETRETMPAAKDEIEEALEENVEINNGWGPKELKVDENGCVTAVVFKKCLATIVDGKFNPQYDEKETMEVKADKVVFAIGQTVVWGNMLEGTNVKFWRGNYPVADSKTFQTDDPSIFVGGDVYTGPKFVIDAIAQGHMAAERLHRYVHARAPYGASLTIGLDCRNFIELNKDDIRVDDYDHAQRQAEPLKGIKEPGMSFEDDRLTLTEEQVKIETSRCLGCGVSVVDPHKCIGCGLCTTRCEFDAIHLVRTHPECTHMVTAEDKFKHIIPYATKRAAKIALHIKPKEVDE